MRLASLPEAGRSVLQNSSLHAVSIKMLLNLLSNEATYLARGWEPVRRRRLCEGRVDGHVIRR